MLQVETHAVGRQSRSAKPTIALVDRGRPLPLSWAQQHLWFLDQLDHAAGAAYQLATAVHVKGALDVPTLRAALDTIVARHEVLRTSFVVLDGQPVQRIVERHCGFALTEQDLSGLAADTFASRLRELSAAAAAEAFDLAAGPLIRGQLLRLGPNEYLLLLTQHHIVADAWSVGVLLRELGALYEAFRQGQPDPLAPLPFQYAEYALWQRQWLREAAPQVDFWTSHLAGAPPLLVLPGDRPHPAAQTHAGGSVPVQWPDELTSRLRALSARHGVTLFMTLFAGWSALLSRLSGQSDLVIGTPVANRERELESLIGCFANILALRVRLESDPTVSELLAQIKATVTEAYTRQDIPFAHVVEALQPARSLSHHPIFQVMLDFRQGTAEHSLRLHGAQVSQREVAARGAPFDLVLLLRESADGITGSLEFATDLFEPATIERFRLQLQNLFEDMVDHDQRRISTLNLLSGAERTQLLVGFNATQAPYPDDLCIQRLFERQAARTPDAIAVVFEGQQLRYGELNAQANRLAHRLSGIGIQPDDRVALCVERGLEMVVGLLAILKAGAAYVPLDPGYPAPRLSYMIEDSAPVALLTQAAVRAVLPALEMPVLLLDLTQQSASVADEPEYNPDTSGLGLTSRHLAYVIYTSGSTGLPKGVMVEHRNVVNFLAAMAGAQVLSASDVLLAVTTLSFDIAALELFLPLISGARLVLASRAAAANPEALSQLIDRQAITVMQATPATWRLMLLSPSWRARPQLRVLCGGEALPVELAIRLARGVGTLWNLYGPTETTIWSTMARLDAAQLDAAASATTTASIGRPIANTQVYLLDAHGEPVPIGVAGEIHIGGAGVARGYLKRADLTAQRFVADPFNANAQDDARLYRTGDLGRWRRDGSIEYLGRNDFQIKLRGFRIEPGEIESRLVLCRGVRYASVVLREDSPGDQRLVAYLAAQRGSEPSAALLRAELARSLPEHMIPTAFVILDALPLTPNGKLDRKALPLPAQSASGNPDYEAPVGEVETGIAQIWQEVLGLPRIGRHDNFFALGGHSLLVLKVLAAIQARFNRQIVMAWIFKAPTPAQLAALLKSRETARSWNHLVALNEGGRGRPLFCLNGFDGDVNDYLHIARYLDKSVPVYGLQVGAAAVDGTLQASLDTRMQAYEQEVRSVQPRGPYNLCGFSFGGSEAFDLASRFEAAGEQVLLILLDAYRPSKSLLMKSWMPRIVSMVKSGTVLETGRRKLQNLFTHEVHHLVTGRDRDLRHALTRDAMHRNYKPFAGRVVLFKSTGFEEWAFQIRLDGFNGWKKYATGSFDVIHVQAGHSALMKEPMVKAVVGHLRAILGE